MWEIPITALIICGTVIFLAFVQMRAQKPVKDPEYEEFKKTTLASINNLTDSIVDMQKNFTEYKSKVNALTLRAGFKS